MIRTLLSKRKLTEIVNNGTVWGWDDPRMPTIRGIVRRGISVAALREFILRQGPSKNVLNLQWGAFWATNKKFIDPIAPRHTAIVEADVVRCHVSGIEKSSSTQKPRHTRNAALGTKTVVYQSEIILEQEDAQSFEEGEEITLMNWGNAIVRDISRDEQTNLIRSMKLDLNLEGNVKTTKKKVTWLAADKTNMVPITLYTFDYLITKEKLAKEDNLVDCLNTKSATKVDTWADCDVAGLTQGTVMQFDRKGYFKLDSAYVNHDQRMVFFDIPSGRD